MNTQRTFLFTLFTILIVFKINAQKLHLKIEGKDSLETRVIDSLNYTKSFLDFNSLRAEIDSTHLRLQKIGYIENKVVSTKKISDSIFASKFELNKKFYTIYIYTLKTSFPKRILQTISDNVTSDYFTIKIEQTESVLNYLNSKLTENGLPFATLKLINLKRKGINNLQADLISSEKKKRTIDDIVIKGYERFPKSYLKHFLKIKSGDAFNLNDIKEKSEALSNLSFANQTRSPEVLFTKDSTSIYFYIEKIKSNSFDGFLGFGTNETTNKLEFDGYLNLNLINSLNFGETFQLNYKSDESDQKTFNVEIALPYLFGSPLGTELELNIFKKDSSFTTVSQSAHLFYQIKNTQRVYLGINAIQSNNLLDSDQTNQNIEDINTTLYTLKYEIHKPQAFNFLFPQNFRIESKFGFGNRTFENEKVTQQVFSVNAFKILNLNDANSIFFKLNASGLFSDSLFTNELLRFGGINSIRGFEENSLISSLYGVLNTEYRYQLNQTIYVHSIIDAAYLENDIALTKEKLFGFGFGFGILTKAGLLKFNYANGKLEGQKFKLSNSKIHLSLNAKF